MEIINPDLTFSPFELNDLDENMPFFAGDPDANYFNECSKIFFQKSEYYTIDSFNSIYDKKYSKSNSVFSISHINIASIPAHLAEFDTFLDCLHLQFKIVAVSETNLTSSNVDVYGIEGYDHVYKPKSVRHRGGVSLFIKSDLSYKTRDDLGEFNDNVESLFVEIDKTRFNEDKNVVAGVVYRPHGNCKGFLDYMRKLLHTLRSENKNYYIEGDFNIDLFKRDVHNPTSEFVDLMYSHSFLPLINRPTRVAVTYTGQSSTLIDNIFTNNINSCNEMLTGIFPINISDHYFIWHISNINLNVEAQEYMLTRQVNETSKSNFIALLENSDWSTVTNETDTQAAYTSFHGLYKKHFDSAFPIKKIKFQYSNRKPWLSTSLKDAIKHKNKLYLKFKNIPVAANKIAYDIFKKQLNKELTAAEKQHIELLFETNKNNLRKTWQIIKGVLNKARNSRIQHNFLSNGKLVSDKNEVAECFNDFFTNIGPTLSRKIPKLDKNALDYITRKQKKIYFPTTCA